MSWQTPDINPRACEANIGIADCRSWEFLHLIQPDLQRILPTALATHLRNTRRSSRITANTNEVCPFLARRTWQHIMQAGITEILGVVVTTKISILRQRFRIDITGSIGAV